MGLKAVGTNCGVNGMECDRIAGQIRAFIKPTPPIPVGWDNIASERAVDETPAESTDGMTLSKLLEKLGGW